MIIQFKNLNGIMEELWTKKADILQEHKKFYEKL